MAESHFERNPVEVLAAEFMARQRAGKRPRVAEYTAQYPQWAAEIRDLFPTIAAIENLKSRQEQAVGRHALLGMAAPKRLGDFRILREIGRGGMGVVYEAEQESLGRRVAVKVLPQESPLTPSRLQRFEREAQTAAKLHHTNIVPVFGVGKQGGYHYYVMQLIDGVGLDRVLAHLQTADTGATDPGDDARSSQRHAGRKAFGEVAEVAQWLMQTHAIPPERTQGSTRSLSKDDYVPWPVGPARNEADQARGKVTTEILCRDAADVAAGADQDRRRAPENSPPSTARPARTRYWRSVAEIGVQAAKALAYAHSQGTLHRDVKPANLLLDSQCVVWVADFGLAKAMEDAAVTETGNIVGTLRYMAPEQFSGTADPRTDVYSLGVTMYELATLRPAYDESNRSVLIQSILHKEPVRPQRIRPEIPRDLETIILKSISREPAARYPSAGAMAEDLQRFLDDRPVRARRIRPPERFWRWCRRNPVVASLTSAVLALTVLAATIAAIGYAETRRAWVSESQQRQKAEATSELAVEALDKIFYQFAPTRINDASAMTFENSKGDAVDVSIQPVVSKETAAVLEQMLEFYGRLGAQGEDDAGLRHKVADATRRVGDIRQRLGHFQQAVAAYERALAIYRDLLPKSSQPTELRTQIASVYNELGRVSHATDDRDQEMASHRQALAMLQAVPSVSAASPGLRYELARTHYYVGRKGLFPPAPPPRGRGNRAFRPGGVDSGPPPPRATDGGQERRAAGRGPGPDLPTPWPDRRRQQQQQHVQKAVDLLESLAAEYPSTPEYRHLLAQCYRDMHPVSFIFSRQAALAANDKAIAILEALVRDFPDVPDFRYALSQTYADSPPPDVTSFLSGDFATVAEERFRTALKISEELVSEHPNVPEFVASQAEILFKLAETIRRAGQPADAEGFLRKALDLQSSLAQRFPDVPAYTMQTTRLEFTLARFLREAGQLAAARSLLETSTAKLEEFKGTAAAKWPVDWILRHHYSELVTLLGEMNEPEAAKAAERRARALGFELPTGPPPRHHGH